MTKKSFPVIVCVFLCLVVSLIFPHLTASRYYVDSALCMQCHDHDTFSSDHDGYDCSICHDVPGSDVTVIRCVECHPSDDPDGCAIVDIHRTMADCLGCHATQCGEDTTHIDTCLTCHVVNELHMPLGHSSCTQCHEATDQGGIIEFSVEPDKCIVCHPFGNPGKCSLANYHGVSCQGCHTECTGGETTTTSVPSGHTGACLVCHYVSDLHAHKDYEVYNDCSQCHDGTPQAGNVKADKCIVCHPTDDPGKCNLADYHGASCLKCHTECTDGTTTTTTTAEQLSVHTDICLECHLVGDLHENDGHDDDDCTQCHDGTSQAGNVKADKCIVCHPTDDPGKCNLANYHGIPCLECHIKCAEDATTTTDTVRPTPDTTTTTTVQPSEHIDVCLVCHSTTDLHDHGGHSDCNQCHDGKTEAGNVGIEKCVVCHPMGDPGKCNLANYHGLSCLECHFKCAEDATPTPDTTTTTTTARCPFKKIYGEDSEETELLRYIRDNILSKTQEGRELIRLYYEWGPVIAKAIEEEEGFKEEVKGMIDEILLLIEKEAK